MRRIDTAGDTLGGVVDGVNRVFVTQLPMVLDSTVQVYRNGLCKVDFLDDGYDLTDARTVTMKEPPELGDTIAVGYQVAGEQLSFGEAPSKLRASIVSPQSLTATPSPLTIRPRGGVAALGPTCPAMTDTPPFRRVYRNGSIWLPAKWPVFVGPANTLVASAARSAEVAAVLAFTETAIAPNAMGGVLIGGIITGCLTGAVAPEPWFLGLDGGCVPEPPDEPLSAAVRLGFAANQTDLIFCLQILVERS